MINKQLENIIKKYEIKNTQNIIYGTNIPMPNKILVTPNKTRVSFDKTEKYFFYFDENGISIYLIEGEDYILIPWNEVINFKMTHIGILGKMTIKTKNDSYQFQINRMVIGCPWIKENRKYLESKNYFYKQNGREE